MLRGYSFRPRLWPLALAAAACAAFVALGSWQARRAEAKRALGAELDHALQSPAIELPRGDLHPEDFVYRKIAARGQYVADRTVFLANRLRYGKPGYEVVTPLRLDASERCVLVNRGWSVAPQVDTPGGEQLVVGIAVERLSRVLQVGADAGRVRQNLVIEAYAAETGLRLQPIVIEQHSEARDGLVRDWPRPDLGIEKHESYALQWYGFAGLALVLGAASCVRRAAVV